MSSKSCQIEFAKEAESVAAAYLQKKEYIILEKNYRVYRGEIDIIAFDDQCLVFVEVKATKRKSDWFAGERINARKQSRLIFAAQDFIQNTHLKYQSVRFDAVLLTLLPKHEWDIVHIRNAFELSSE